VSGARELKTIQSLTSSIIGFVAGVVTAVLVIRLLY
jgi:hypothetical protein